nr:uncharacterized protein LOC129452945 [Misgurnus anguillicaudatus]
MTDVILSLSWYKENRLLYSISESDLNIRLSLPLVVDYQNNNTYRCVVNNPLINQTQHLNITHLCQPCSDSVNSCATTEAVIRLVVSALMGVAAVAASVVLIYDIRGPYHENGVFGFKVKSVMEGDSVTLHADITEIQRADLIEWRCVNQGFHSYIARINRSPSSTSIYDDVLDGRFRDRLQVADQTGDLTITNITTHLSGLYQMIIIGSDYIKETSSRYYITVYTRLPIPVITFNSSQCPSSSSSVSKCVLLCSVLNVRDVSLSWYKGNSLLSSISVSDLNIRLSLPLEVDYQDTNTYSCVVNNPFRNQTQHLNITDVCQPCSDCVSCCDTTEAVIRLVASALVGVATVAVLIFDIRSRRAEQERNTNFI